MASKHANARACVNRGTGNVSHIVLVPVEGDAVFVKGVDVQGPVLDNKNNLQFVATVLNNSQDTKRLHIRLECVGPIQPPSPPGPKRFDTPPDIGQLSVTLTDTTVAVIPPTVDYVDDDPCAQVP